MRSYLADMAAYNWSVLALVVTRAGFRLACDRCGQTQLLGDLLPVDGHKPSAASGRPESLGTSESSRAATTLVSPWPGCWLIWPGT